MNKGDAFLLGALIAVAIAIGMLALRTPLVAVVAASNSGTAADWVSAIFGGLAVIAAVGVGWSAIWTTSQETKARGRVAAFRLVMPMVAIRGDVKRALGCFPRLRGIANSPSPVIPFSLQEHLHIGVTIPPDVFAESWTLPPHIALAVSQLDSLLVRQGLWLSNIDSTFIVSLPSGRIGLLSGVEEHLRAIEQLAVEVSDYVTAVNDAVVISRRARS